MMIDAFLISMQVILVIVGLLVAFGWKLFFLLLLFKLLDDLL